MPTVSVKCPRCRVISEATLGVPYPCPGQCGEVIFMRPKAAAAPPPAPEPLSLDDEPGPPPPAPPRPAAPNRSALYAGIAAGVVLLLAAAGVGAYLVFGKKSADPADPNVAQTEKKPDAKKPDPGKAGDDDEDEVPAAKQLPALPHPELERRLHRATVFVFSADPADKKLDRANLGWLFHPDRQLIVTRADVVKGRQTAVVVFPAFNEKGEFIRDADYYLSRIVNKPDELVYDAEVVGTDGDGEVGLAALRIKLREKQKPPALLSPLPLAAGGAASGEEVLCPDVSGWGNDVVLKPLYGRSQGLSRKSKALEIDRELPDDNRGGPVINDRGELVATLYGLNADKKSSRGTDVERVRLFLKDVFRQAGWTWHDAQVAQYEPKDRLATHLARLQKATAPGHILDKYADPPPAVPAEAKAKQLLHLRRIGGMGEQARDAVPVVARYLRSGDPEVRQMAYQVLRGVRVVNDLDKSLFAAGIRSWSLEARMYAAWAYGRVAAPADVIEVFGTLLKESDPKNEKAELRVLLLTAVANNHVNAKRHLTRDVIDSLDDRVGEVQNAAAEQLGLLIKDLPAPLVDDLVDKIANDIPRWHLEKDFKKAEHWETSQGVGRFVAATILAETWDVKKVEYERFRKLFYPRLTERPNAAASVTALNSSRLIRVTAAKALARWGVAARDCLRPQLPSRQADWDRDHLKGLVDLTADPVQEVRLAAVKAIKAIGTRTGARLVVRSGKIEGAEDIDLVAVLDGLADADPDDGVQKAARDAAVTLLEAAPREQDAAVLRKLLRGSEGVKARADIDQYRTRAARVLGVLGKTAGAKPAVAAAVPELVAAVRQPAAEGDPDPALQTAALNTLALIGDHLAGEKPAAAATLAAKAATEVLTPVGKVGTAQPGTPAAGPDVATRLVASAVWVRTDRGDGTGVVVAGGASPLVVTNYHVIARARRATVFFPALTPDRREIGTASYYAANEAALRRTRQAQTAFLVAADPQKDLAVLRLAAPLPDGAAPVRFAAEGVRTGQKLHLRGMSGVDDGSLWRYTTGEVRQVLPNKTIRYRTGQTVTCKLIEHSMPINPGDSGSGVVNDRGELVAVTCALDPDSRSVGYAVDREEVVALLRQPGRGPRPAGLDDGGGRLETDAVLAPVVVGVSDAPATVQAAAIRLLRALGSASIAPLAQAVEKVTDPAQAVQICNAIREFAEKHDPADHPELVSVCRVVLIPAGKAATDPNVREEVSRLVATVGGAEVIGDLIAGTWSVANGRAKQNTLENRVWAVKTLGRLDPGSPWLKAAGLRQDVLASEPLRARYKQYVRAGKIDDADMEKVVKDVRGRLTTCLNDIRINPKSPADLVAEAKKGLVQLERSGVK